MSHDQEEDSDLLFQTLKRFSSRIFNGSAMLVGKLD
jgi:hypothetical protein